MFLNLQINWEEEAFGSKTLGWLPLVTRPQVSGAHIAA
jgi:hypothetical protein